MYINTYITLYTLITTDGQAKRQIKGQQRGKQNEMATEIYLTEEDEIETEEYFKQAAITSPKQTENAIETKAPQIANTISLRTHISKD